MFCVNPYRGAKKSVNKNSKKIPDCVHQHAKFILQKTTRFRAELGPGQPFLAPCAGQYRDDASRVDQVPTREKRFAGAANCLGSLTPTMER